jgi:hypothetical protein
MLTQEQRDEMISRILDELLKANPPKKTRYVRGVTSGLAREIYGKLQRKLILWAMNLNPGDRINSVDGCNHIVKTITIQWRPVQNFLYSHKRKNGCHWVRAKRQTSGTYVANVYIETTNGWAHNVDDWVRVVPAMPVDCIKSFMTKQVIDKEIELGILDKDCNRLRAPTNKEYEVIGEIYKQYKIGPKSV